VHVLGITGMQQIKQYPTLISNGFPSVLGSMSVPFHLVVPAKLPDDRTQEWRDILVKAAKSKTVIDTYAVDSCVPSNMSESEMQAWFRAQAVQWKKIGADVKLAK
jgi:tripartite-type tricarboxylate transporter receptor subunit TctC